MLIGVTSTLNCGREVTAPERGALSRAVAIQPTFRVASGAALVASGVDFARLRMTLARRDGTIAYDRTVDFPASADSVQLSLAVPLSREAGPEGERMALRLGLITSGGDTVFRNGPDTLLMEPARTGVQPAAVAIDVFYIGPGAQATRVALTSAVTDTVSGSALTFSAQAFDAQDVLVPDAPVLFTSSDTALLQFANARSGAATTGLQRGSVFAIASLLTGPADSVSVALALPASVIAAVSGGGQSALNGTALSAPVVVFVSASDGVAVPGVTVEFAAAAGGQATDASVVTDVNGRASTTWTLGTASGVQTLSATAAGLSGSPVAFTATALAGVATQLAFVTQPATSGAGASLGSVTVQARDVSGNLDATFVGAVTVAIGTNPGSATLSGVATVNAIGGVATFAGLSLDVPATGYTLAATASGVTGATSVPFDVAAGPAAALVFSVQPINSGADSPITPAVQVTARDAVGNTATAFTGAVTIAIGNNTGGATLAGPTTVNAVAGVATFAGLSLNLVSTGYTLTASASGVTGATSAAFAIVPALNEWTNAAGGLWSAPANWSLARAPRPSDDVVIALPGTYAVTLDTTFTGTLLTVGGGSGTQTLALASRTLTLSGLLSIATTGVLALDSAIVAAPIVNSGTIRVAGEGTLSGTLTTVAGSVLRVANTQILGSSRLTITNGFTNLGLIELTNSEANGSWGAFLTVSTGTLVNAPSGTIAARIGALTTSPAGQRRLTALVDNQGTISVPDALTSLNIFPPTDAVWESTGTIAVGGGNIGIVQSGPGASFTNRGTLNVPAGRILSVNGGSFTHAAGATLDGGGTLYVLGNAAINEVFALSTLEVGGGSTLALGAGTSTAGTTITLGSGTTVTGPGTLTNSLGRTLQLASTTVTAPMVNAGTLQVLNAGNSISGPLTTTATSLVQVGAFGGAGSDATLTVASGFTNSGVIELSNFSDTADPWSSTLSISSGVLVNAPGGTIRALPGTVGGGARTLSASLDNQGTLALYPGGAGLLTVIGDVTTSGIINLAVGGLSAGTQYGRLAVNGALSLGGTLNVGLFGGYVPVSGNTFTLLTSTGATTGAFATPNLTAPLAPPVTYSANAVTVGVP